MVEHAGQHVGHHDTTRDAHGSLQSAAKETGAAWRGCLGRGILLLCRLLRRTVPRRLLLLLRLLNGRLLTRTAAKQSRQEAAAALCRLLLLLLQLCHLAFQR